MSAIRGTINVRFIAKQLIVRGNKFYWFITEIYDCVLSNNTPLIKRRQEK